jgi:hypothetical protein
MTVVEAEENVQVYAIVVVAGDADVVAVAAVVRCKLKCPCFFADHTRRMSAAAAVDCSIADGAGVARQCSSPVSSDDDELSPSSDHHHRCMIEVPIAGAAVVDDDSSRIRRW